MEMLFQYEVNCLEILSFKDKLKSEYLKICFQTVKCGNYISSKDILEDEIIWENYLESDDVAHLY